MRRPQAPALALWLALGLGAALLTFTPHPQAAAQSKANRKKAQGIFQQGQAHFQRGEFREAGVLFLQAFDLDPHPAILYNVARAFEEAGELPRSLNYYRRALSLQPPDRIAEEVGAKIREIELYLRAQGVDVTNPEAAWSPRGTLTVRTDPDGADVLLNNIERLGNTPLQDHPVPQGAYTVIVRKPGFQDLRREITVIAGRSYLIDQRLDPEAVVVQQRPVGFIDVSAPRRNLMVFVDGEPRALTPVGGLELEAGPHRISVEAVEDGDDFPTWEAQIELEEGQTLPLVAAWPKPVVIPQEETQLLSQSQWGWVFAGAGGLSLLTGGAFGVLALTQADSYDTRRGDPGRALYRDDAQTWALTADVFFGLGLGLGTLGALLIALDDGPEGPGDPAYEQLVRHLLLGPAPDGQGLGAGAAFTW